MASELRLVGQRGVATSQQQEGGGNYSLPATGWSVPSSKPRFRPPTPHSQLAANPTLLPAVCKPHPPTQSEFTSYACPDSSCHHHYYCVTEYAVGRCWGDSRCDSNSNAGLGIFSQVEYEKKTSAQIQVNTVNILNTCNDNHTMIIGNIYIYIFQMVKQKILNSLTKFCNYFQQKSQEQICKFQSHSQLTRKHSCPILLNSIKTSGKIFYHLRTKINMSDSSNI